MRVYADMNMPFGLFKVRLKMLIYINFLLFLGVSMFPSIEIKHCVLRQATNGILQLITSTFSRIVPR